MQGYLLQSIASPDGRIYQLQNSMHFQILLEGRSSYLYLTHVVGLSEIVGWAASCHTTAQRFWVGELRQVQLQLTSDWLVCKLNPLC